MAREYTQMGFGDMCQADEQEDNRPVCLHCGNHFDAKNGIEDEYCSANCWHLDNIGEVKKQVNCWLNIGYTSSQIISFMYLHLYFVGMTDSTVNRWKRAITTRYEQDRAILAQAAEIENYNDGY